MRLELADGTRIRVRPIRPSDKELLALGLQRLSPETIHRRFLQPKTRFTPAELRYLTEVDGHDHMALVAFEDGEPGELVAVARLVRLQDRRDTAEAAIVVGDEWQRRGLGRRLAVMLADAARERGIARITATFRGDNLAAQRLLATIAARLHAGPPLAGAIELTAELAA